MRSEQKAFVQYSTSGCDQHPSKSRGLSGHRERPCQRKWVDAPRGSMQRCQENILVCSTAARHGRRLVCSLSSGRAWPSSQTSIVSKRRCQISARADKQERQWTNAYRIKVLSSFRVWLQEALWQASHWACEDIARTIPASASYIGDHEPGTLVMLVLFIACHVRRRWRSVFRPAPRRWTQSAQPLPSATTLPSLSGAMEIPSATIG